MKLVWCPKMASDAYIDAVKAVERHEEEDSATAELVAAMAGGWKAHLVVEAWDHGGGATTSLGLSVAVRHTRGRHVCVLAHERARLEYEEVVGPDVAEIIVGEAEKAMKDLDGVDFLVVDWQRADADMVVREARPGVMGMVVVCRSAGEGEGRMEAAEKAATVGGRRVVKSVYLPVGSGMHIMHVGMGMGWSEAFTVGGSNDWRWMRNVDRRTGEEHLFRR